MKNLILVFVALIFCTHAYGTVVICNDMKFECIVINHLNLANGGTADAYCHDFHFNSGSDWDCVDDCPMAFNDDDDTSSLNRSSEGASIVNGKLVIDGVEVGMVNNKELKQNQKLKSVKFKTTMEIENLKIAEVELRNGNIFIDGELLEGVSLTEGMSFESASKITLKDKTENPDDINIFPNPFVNELNIIPPKDIRKLEIFNVNGQKVSESAVDNNKIINRLNVSSLEFGAYFITFFRENNEKFTKKILKSN